MPDYRIFLYINRNLKSLWKLSVISGITMTIFLLSLYLTIRFSVSSKIPYTMNQNKFPLSQYSKEFLFKVGKVPHLKGKKANYFLDFPQKKKAKVIRIGTFGDSQTYGKEVQKGESYPEQLQDLFNQFSSDTKVEVLNFGVSGYGFQRNFLFWEEYAKKYNLDYILFGPFGFQPERDLSFTEQWSTIKPSDASPWKIYFRRQFTEIY